MELTLKRLLEQATFTKSRGRYDAQEVDELLDRAVAMATKVEARLNQAIQEAEVASGPSADEIEARVEELVQERLAGAGAAVDPDAAAEEAVRTIRMAQRTADDAIREAQEEAAALLSAAQESAAELDRQTAERSAALAAAIDAETAEERASARAALAAEIDEIEAARDALKADVAVLDNHLELQRTQIGLALAEMQRLLDDPEGFRHRQAPDLQDPALPDLAPAAAESDDVDPESAADEVEPAEAEDALADTDEADEFDADADVLDDGDGLDEVDEPVQQEIAVEEAFILEFEEIDHAAPGVDEMPDSGPPTAPISVIDLDAEARADDPEADDAFLAELRKAMDDDEPLGPREHDDPANAEAFYDDEDRRSWRFGKRRS